MDLRLPGSLPSPPLARAFLAQGVPGAGKYPDGGTDPATWAPLPPPTMPTFRAYRTTNQTISTSAGVKVQCDVEAWDTEGWYDNATNFRFTPQIAGKYLFSGVVRYDDVADTNLVTLGFRKNGTDEWNNGHTTRGAFAMLNVTALIDMNGTTDFVELFTFHNKGANATLTASRAECSFAGTLVSKDP